MPLKLIGTEFLMSLFQVRFKVIGYDFTERLYIIQNIEPMKCSMDDRLILQAVREGHAKVEGNTMTALLEGDVIQDCIRLEKELSKVKH